MFHYLIAAGLILMAMPLSGANLLENASLLWSGVGHGGAKGAVTGKSTGFRFRKTNSPGTYIFFNRKAIPLQSGKTYRVTMKVSGLGNALTAPRLMINFPNFNDRKPHDLSAPFSNGTAELIFTAAEQETQLRCHFRAGGIGEAVIEQLTVSEYRPRACYDPVNFPGERLAEIRNSITEELPRLRQQRDALYRQFLSLNRQSAPHFNDKIVKRFELVDRLFHFIDEQLQTGDTDSLLFARRGCTDLRQFFAYFEREFQIFEEETNPKAPRILDLRSFGARGDGVTDDAPAFARALAEAAQSEDRCVIRIPAGQYLLRQTSTVKRGDMFPDVISGKEQNVPFWITLSFHLLLAGQRNLTLQGEAGSELLFEHPGESGIGIVACQNVALRDLTIRYVKPTFTQGTILSVNEKDNSILWKADEGFPAIPRKTDGVCQTHDAATREILPEASGKFLGKVTALPDGSCRIVIRRSFRPTPVWKLEKGQKFIIPFRDNERQGIWLLNSAFCTMERVTVLNAPASGFCSSRGMAHNFIDCRIKPQPGAVFSTNADGIHCWNDRIGHYISGCEIQNMGDDSFNSCTTGFYIAGERGGDLLVLGRIAAGNPLTMICPETGVIRQETTVTAVRPENWNGRSVQRHTLADPIPAGTVSYESLRRTPYSQTEIRAKNHGAGELPEEPDVAFNFSSCGIGTVITGNHFYSNRNNGVVIQCPNSLVENNSLSRLACAIRVGSFLTWKEGPPPYNITLRENRISRSACAIQTGYTLRSRNNAECRPLRQFSLQNNRISDCSSPLQLANLEGVELIGNRIETARPDALIRFENIGRIMMSGNFLQRQPWERRDVQVLPPIRRKP